MIHENLMPLQLVFTNFERKIQNDVTTGKTCSRKFLGIILAILLLALITVSVLAFAVFNKETSIEKQRIEVQFEVESSLPEEE